MGKVTIITHTLFTMPGYFQTEKKINICISLILTSKVWNKIHGRIATCILVSVRGRTEPVYKHPDKSGDENPNKMTTFFFPPHKTEYFLTLSAVSANQPQDWGHDFLQCHYYPSTIMVSTDPMNHPNLERIRSRVPNPDP